MKTRANPREEKSNATPRRRAKNWKRFTASDWTFAAKAMGEMRILARLARQLNNNLDELSTALVAPQTRPDLS